MRLHNVRTYALARGEWPMYLDDSATTLAGPEFENTIPWMYLDTRGYVTVASGRALFSVDDASALPFGVGGRVATFNEVKLDYNRVKAMKPGLPARAYKCPTSPVLDAGTMHAMLLARVEENDKALRARMSGYKYAPDAAKVALLDMAYNLGVAGLMEFRLLAHAVSMGMWPSCADLCHRVGPSETRNDWTKRQFQIAAGQALTTLAAKSA